MNAAGQENGRGAGAPVGDAPIDLGFTLGASVQPPPPGGAVDAATERASVASASVAVEASAATEAVDAVDTDTPTIEPSVEDRARELAVRIAHELAEAGPPGWRQMSAVFALTVAVGGGEVRYVDGADQVVVTTASPAVLELAAAQRRVCAELGDGPWWRMLLLLDAEGQIEIQYDHGEEPIPAQQLFAPQAYLADLAEFPRSSLPLWLSAYLYHDGRQARPPGVAAEQARADRQAVVSPVLPADDLPDLPSIWVRWSVVSAAFVAMRSEWGPRIMPSYGWFEDIEHSGATLYLLPRGRAVLSGGVREAPALVAAYRDGSELPGVYAGAPAWVVDQVLDPRAASGMLSFCYWWSGDRWFRGGSPDAEHLVAALPSIWDDESAEAVIRDLVGVAPGDPRANHITALLTAGFEGDLTRAHLVAVFGADADIDAAMNQVTTSGAAAADL